MGNITIVKFELILCYTCSSEEIFFPRFFKYSELTGNG